MLAAAFSFCTGVAALDIQKLLCAQIGTETGLSDGIVGQRKAQLGSQHAVAAVGDVGKGTAVDDGGVVFQRLYKVRVQRVLQQGGHGTGSTDLTGSDGLAVVGVGAYDLGKTLLQIRNAGGKAENCHHLAGNRVIFMRRYWFSDSCKDIAEFVGLSEKNISVRLTRIRQKMKSYLAEREVFV